VETRSLRILEEPQGAAAPGDILRDGHGRRIRYLRLSVTDRCDLRCRYCMPAQGQPTSPRPEVLSIEELLRAAKIFRDLGVTTVRLTGGEPLVRRGLVDLVSALRFDLGIQDLALTTNGTLLAGMAEPLRRAGLRRLNISLDTLRPERFRALTLRDELARVLEGIEAASEAGFEEPKLNTVAMKGFNDDELGDLVDFAWERGYTPRLIELMPVGEGAPLMAEHHLPTSEMLQLLGDRVAGAPEARSEGRGPARYFASRSDPDRQVGFISALSDRFCEGCNRVRLSARGELRPCLASPRGISLRDLLRSGAGDREIARAVRAALWNKEEGHHYLDDQTEAHRRVAMPGIGG
jgi:cyclic pyranopterin phosphate synthase